MVAGLPQTVGFQASLILIQPAGRAPAQTFCAVKVAPRDKGASVGPAGGSPCSGVCGFASAAGAAGRFAATPGDTSSVALVMGPGLEEPLLQATRAVLPGERSGDSTPTWLP